MSTQNLCEFCKKSFSSKRALKIHIETVCNRSEELTFICTFCNLNLSSESSLRKHLKSCSKKEEYALKQIISQHAQEIQNLIEKHNKEIQDIKVDNNNKVHTLENNLKDVTNELSIVKMSTSQVIESLKEVNTKHEKEIEFLRGRLKSKNEQIESFEKHFNKITNHSTYVNNTINNSNIINLYVQNLEPITDELLKETGKTVGITDLKNSAKGIIEKFQPVLKDKVICTDATRNSLLYNYNGQIKRDTRGQMLTDKIMSSIEPQYQLYNKEIHDYYEDKIKQEENDIEREDLISRYNKYKDLDKSLRIKNEVTKKKISKRISKYITNFSRSKAQFDSMIQQNIQKISDQTSETVSCKLVQPESSQVIVVPKEERARFQKVVARKQIVKNRRTFEQHFDEDGNIVKEFRLRSSGLPYLTDEDTDPSSREDSEFEDSDLEDVYTEKTENCTSQITAKCNWDMQL